MRKVLISGLILGLLLCGYTLWSVSMLLPPILVGVILAYVFRPLKNWFHFSWLPHEMGVVLAFSFILIATSLVVIKVKSFLPTEREELELKIRLNYKLNEKFEEFFKKEDLFAPVKMIGKEIEPAVLSVSSLLELTPEEMDWLEKHRIGSSNDFSEKYYAYHLQNLKRKNDNGPNRTPSAVLEFSESGEIKNSEPSSESPTFLLYTLSLWMICPLVFLFLIFDNGQIRKFLVGLVPNSYFEVTLTLLDRLDEALGLYLRGTAMECSLVGFSTFVGLALLGFPLPVAILLALLCGVLNAVPFLGPTVGALAVFSYALIAESIDPVLLFVSLESLPVASLIVISVVQILDNVLFAPIVLGRAVNLHPLVVIISLSISSILFGVWGVIATIPSVVVGKTIVHTLVTQLKAYRLI